MTEPTTAHKTFFERVRECHGGAVIFAGSGSDESHIEQIVKSCESFHIPYEVRIASAHKQQQKLLTLLGAYDTHHDLQLVYVAVTGGTDALSGTLSYHSSRPTISCPPDHPNASCINNPLGSSNMYVGHPANVGRAVAQILSLSHEKYGHRLSASKAKKEIDLDADDVKLHHMYGERQEK
ncbi:MAG: AIR carboxylase family protein [Nanoarchaeota archaeon]